MQHYRTLQIYGSSNYKLAGSELKPGRCKGNRKYLANIKMDILTNFYYGLSNYKLAGDVLKPGRCKMQMKRTMTSG